MRTAVHIFLIVVIGLVIGLALRQMRNQSQQQQTVTIKGPDGDIEVVIDEEQPTRVEAPPKPDLPEDANWVREFTLTERSGREVTSESLKGQPYVVSFFFTQCPSICIQQNQALKELADKFAGQDVKFLSISVDAENDTPEALREYAARFGADPDQWLFLTTDDPIYIQRVGAEMFQVSANLQHTERFILMNPEGDMEALYRWSDPRSLKRLEKDLQEMIAANKPAKDAA